MEEEEPAHFYQKPLNIDFVSSIDSPEFTHLTSILSHTSVIGLDAEWKPIRTRQSTFPTVSLLQIACLLSSPDESTQFVDELTQDAGESNSVVFLVDLSVINLPSIYELLRQMFESADILKLGFRFKQDLSYLSSTFLTQGCNSGFHLVEPYLDISSIYYHLNPKPPGRRVSKETKSLAVICKEMLGVSLSKELQCSDWSSRPLTNEQMTYAAMDAYCLIEIFNVFLLKVLGEGNLFHNGAELDLSKSDIQILKEPSGCNEDVQATAKEVTLRESFINTIPMNDNLLQIVRNYCDKIVLKESDTKPKISKNKSKRQSCSELISKERQINDMDDWQGPPPWDRSLGGDGYPKFLCDVMVEGLAKHLRCVGLDAAVPNSRKPSSRDLIEQAYKEKRVLLTRDTKLKRYDYLLNNQIYRVKELLKNQQLVEVIKAFQLEINENQLMSRCTKCNGMFIQKPLSTEEAIEAAKGFQVIPNCLFNKNLEFWQCMDCNQLYWEGTQYHNAVQKFIDVCNLNAA